MFTIMFLFSVSSDKIHLYKKKPITQISTQTQKKKTIKFSEQRILTSRMHRTVRHIVTVLDDFHEIANNLFTPYQTLAKNVWMLRAGQEWRSDSKGQRKKEINIFWNINTGASAHPQGNQCAQQNIHFFRSLVSIAVSSSIERPSIAVSSLSLLAFFPLPLKCSYFAIILKLYKLFHIK